MPRDPDNVSWSYLYDESLCDDLVAAHRHGQAIGPVLTKHGVSKDTYAAWLRIGRGKMETWRNGRPIAPLMAWACWDLVCRVQQARIDYEQAELQRLAALQPTA